MAVSTFQVTGTFQTPDGVIESGYVEFVPNKTPFVNAGVLVDARTVRANIDASGQISIVLTRCSTGYTATAFLGAGGLGSTKGSGPLSKVAQIADQSGIVDVSTLAWA